MKNRIQIFVGYGFYFLLHIFSFCFFVKSEGTYICKIVTDCEVKIVAISTR